MTPKEKALELVNKHAIYCNGGGMFAILQSAKQCSIILVDEMLNEYNKYLQSCNTKDLAINYWIEVKQEIEKL